MLKILKYPDQFLRKTAKEVSVFDAELEKLAQDMAQIMYQEDGVGLAGPQVKAGQRLIVVGQDNHRDYKVYVNPEITLTSKDKTTNEEGCLSLPEIFGLVERPKKIHLKYQDLKGKIHKEKFKGLPAVIIQHEVDHLNGILFIDRAKKIVRGQHLLEALTKNK
jgi:peptide deformylase